MKKEWKMLQIRFIVLLVVMISSAVVVVLTRNFAIGALNSPEIQQYIKNSSKIASIVGKISTNFTYYSFSQWFGKSYIQLVAIFAIILSSSSFSKEFSKKTIYLIASRMTRWQVYISKNSIGWIAFSIIVISGGIGYLIAAQLAGYHLQPSQVLSWTFTSTIGGLLLYQIGMYLSLLFKDQMKPLVVGIAIYIGLYITSFVREIKFLNVFSYMAQDEVLFGKGVNIFSTFVALGIFAVIFVCGYFQFKFKDL